MSDLRTNDFVVEQSPPAVDWPNDIKLLSSTLNKNIALCRMDMQYSEIGTQVEIGKIDGHQKRIVAKVVGFPFYDPTKSRVRS